MSFADVRNNILASRRTAGDVVSICVVMADALL